MCKIRRKVVAQLLVKAKIRRKVVAQLLVKATDEKLKNNKNEFLYLNWIEKIVRYLNYIICVIFKV